MMRLTKQSYSRIAFFVGWLLIYFSVELSTFFGISIYFVVIPAVLLFVVSAIEFIPKLFDELKNRLG